jgi:hypothetical protein
MCNYCMAGKFPWRVQGSVVGAPGFRRVRRHPVTFREKSEVVTCYVIRTPPESDGTETQPLRARARWGWVTDPIPYAKRSLARVRKDELC